MLRCVTGCIVAAVVIGCAAPEGPSSGAVLARELGIVTRGHCAFAPVLATVDPSCVRIPGRVELDASLDVEPAWAAFDGDVCRSWNTGRAAPTWIGLDFEDERLVSGVALVVRGSGEARHTVETSIDGATFTPAAVLAGALRDADAYAVLLPKPVVARHLRVVTERAEGTVAWREIAPLACGDAAEP